MVRVNPPPNDVLVRYAKSSWWIGILDACIDHMKMVIHFTTPLCHSECGAMPSAWTEVKICRFLSWVKRIAQHADSGNQEIIATLFVCKAALVSSRVETVIAMTATHILFPHRQQLGRTTWAMFHRLPSDVKSLLGYRLKYEILSNIAVGDYKNDMLPLTAVAASATCATTVLSLPLVLGEDIRVTLLAGPRQQFREPRDGLSLACSSLSLIYLQAWERVGWRPWTFGCGTAVTHCFVHSCPASIQRRFLQSLVDLHCVAEKLAGEVNGGITSQSSSHARSLILLDSLRSVT